MGHPVFLRYSGEQVVQILSFSQFWSFWMTLFSVWGEGGVLCFDQIDRFCDLFYTLSINLITVKFVCFFVF